MQPSDIMFQTKLLRYIHVPLYPACISQHKGPLDAKTMKLQWTQIADDVVLCTPIFCTQNTHFPGQHFLTPMTMTPLFKHIKKFAVPTNL